MPCSDKHQLSKTSAGLPIVIGIALLSWPSDLYGMFYLASTLMGSSGGRWFAQLPFYNTLIAAWFLTAIVGPLLCVAVIVLDAVLLLRKGASQKMKVLGTLLTALSIVSTLIVASQVIRW